MRSGRIVMLGALLLAACGDDPRIALRYELVGLSAGDVIRVETRVVVAPTDARAFIADRPYTSVETGVGYEVRDFDGTGIRALLITHDASLGYAFEPRFVFTLLPPEGDAPPLEIRARALGAGLNAILADTGRLVVSFDKDTEAELPLADLRCGGVGLCAGEEACCDGRCTDVTSDPAACGACGQACGTKGDGCSGGTCRCNGGGGCAAGQTCCPGLGCVDTASDPFHCGTCDLACALGEACVAGACRCGSVTCAAGQNCCDGVCTDGGCACGAATCAVETPICCGGSDCVDLRDDSASCGACGRTCKAPLACGDGQCKCNGNSICGASDTCCSTGCKALATDPLNCGACEHACGPGEACVGSSCRCGDGEACAPGQLCCADANGQRRCYDGQNDKDHCGTCDTSCATTERCVGGSCTCPGVGMSCSAGTTCCPFQGCFDLTADHDNCGQCGRACAFDETCTAGSCVPGAGCTPSCTNGTSCGNGACFCGALQTRCESPGQRCCPPQAGCVNTNDDLQHCGGCDNGCAAQGKDLCCSGVCRSSSSNGSCGGCGKVCSWGQTCQKCNGVFKCSSLACL
jgi:hypothetical protein